CQPVLVHPRRSHPVQCSSRVALCTRPPQRCPPFFFNDPATTQIYTLSLHDALPIWPVSRLEPTEYSSDPRLPTADLIFPGMIKRSEEHTSELQSRENLVCRLLLEKKKRSPRALALPAGATTCSSG